MIDVIERRQGDSAAQRMVACGFGCRHTNDIESGPDPLPKKLDKMLRRRTGAEPKLHATLNITKRSRGGLPLQFVHVYVHAMPH
jgi:hypothetical protein